MTKRWCGYCPNHSGKCAVCNGTGIGLTHDAYGNPYGENNRCHHCGGDGNCIVCNGTRRNDEDCKHDDLTPYPDRQSPRVYCNDCGFRWVGIPADTRVHTGMYAVLKDAVLEGRDSDAQDIMNQYLDWRPGSKAHTFVRRISNRFQGPPDETCELCGCDPRNTIHRIASEKQ